jgi:hypothetical protein
VEIEQSFFQDAGTRLSLPIAFDGELFDPSVDAPNGIWIEVAVARNNNANKGLADSSRGVERGFIQLTLCRRPSLRGNRIALADLAKSIRALYPNGYRFASGHRITDNTNELSVITQPDKIMLPVSIAYSA